MVKLSFIVPVYNVASYLCKCVDSLLQQDYEKFEVILVDDGSPDECPVICDQYAAKYDNVCALHQVNGGLSAARNAGLKVAKGEYVCFVDSDDFWEENVLGGLMGQIERERLDVLRFDYRNVNEHYEVVDPNKYPHPVDTCTDIETGEQYLNGRMFYTCYAVMYIIKRGLIVKNEEWRDKREACLFTVGIHYEDVDWFPRMMLRASRVNSTTTIVYNYLIRQGSITQVQGDKNKIRKNLEDNYFVLNTLTKLQKQYPNCVWLHRMVSMIASMALVTIAVHFYDERHEYIQRLRSQNVFPLQIANQGKTYRRRAKLINLIGPKLYCMVMHFRH